MLTGNDYLQSLIDKVEAKFPSKKKKVLKEEELSSKGTSLKHRRDKAAGLIGEFEELAAQKWEDREKSFEGKFNSREDLLDYLQQYPASPFSLINKPNVIKMKTRNCGLTIESTTEFNAVVAACQTYFKNEIEFTASNGIKMARRFLTREGWGVRYTGKGIPELLVISFRGMWRFQYRGAGKHKPEEYGTQSWREFKKDCKKEGVDLEAIAVPAGKEAQEAKSQVPRPRIEVINKGVLDLTFSRVHHVDIHSAHPFYICEKFPQLKPVIYKYYEQRKDPKIGKKMKQRLVNLSGYSESEGCKFRYSRMAKAAKEGTNQRVEEIIQELRANGRTPLAVNTDGVWYSGERYHFKDEGDRIGQLNTDYTNCKFRIKSAGLYEFEDENGYHARFRGRSALELVKPRKEWQWGDIYKTGGIIKFPYNPVTLRFNIGVDVQ